MQQRSPKTINGRNECGIGGPQFGRGSACIADRFIDQITARFCVLARNPNVGLRRDNDLRPGTRTFPVGDYIISYRLEEGDVRILHVARGSRNIEALFGL